MIDADDKARETLVRMLRHLGFRAKSVDNATAALLEMERSSYTVLIADITRHDPDGTELIDGLELIKQVKATHPNICILTMTSHSENYTYIDVIEAGAADFINTPVLIGELEAKLKRAITERNIKEELSNLSITDPLTGLYNRRHFEQRLGEEVIRAESQDLNLSLLMIDLDDFNSHTDTRAHGNRDEMLQKSSRVITQSIKKGLDQAFRLRGNQFAVILIGSDRESARVICTRIRKGLEQNCHIGAAFGIAVFKKGASSNALSEAADKALYNTKQESILAVDNDELVLEPIAEMLRHLGFRTVSVKNGEDALDQLKRNPFTLLLTDIKMPGMSGLELIQRAKNAYPDLCVVAMTAYTEEYTYMEVIESGATDFINKPFAYTELEAKIARAIRERDVKRKLSDLSITDSLTGLHNQHCFFERLEQEVNRAERQDNRLSLIMIDLDNFKDHNDKYGHRSGDEVLQKVGEIISACIRRGVDTGYRYGGDEFAIILIDSDMEIAHFISKRIAKTLEQECNISASFGSATFKKGMKSEELMENADRKLYARKAEKHEKKPHAIRRVV
ncbi:MAG: diguanylate cyclase [Deltaproteobacteria bacterium]|nr:diguanylate cyclase [Deltaproteobacteria bacterium]